MQWQPRTVLVIFAVTMAMALHARCAVPKAPDKPIAAATQPVTAFPPIAYDSGPFTADAGGLAKYRVPDWFRDAKLGIWAHWGPQSVPMEGDWYARQMYIQGSVDYADHLARFGHPSKAGYKDIIPLWKAEKWDPDALMTLYKKAGARYFVAQAVHHDNFDNWNSRWHSWNAVNMGPHRDVVGDWQSAALRQGLRFGVSEHLGASFTWFQPAHGSDRSGAMMGIPYDGANPLYQELYHFPAKPGDSQWYSSDPRWQQEWYARITDLVDQYHPDLLYSDGGVPFGNQVGLGLIAHLYNSSAELHGGVPEAVYNCKQASHGMWVEDVERGVMPGILADPWQTDTSIGDWFYNKHWKYRSAQWVIHSLIDIVSKNGNLLINVVQKPDGTLDDDALKIVNDLASWISINGEAIFDTRPWLVYGEGKAKSKGGSFNENHDYTADDIRFTRRGDHTIYAFALGWPDSRRLLIKSLAKLDGVTGNISNVTLLGSSQKVDWKWSADGLSVGLPDKSPCDFAVALKIDCDNASGFKPQLAIRPPPLQADDAGNLILGADDAELSGELKVETYAGCSNIGYWNNTADTARWRFHLAKPGRYSIVLDAAAAADSVLDIGLQGKTFACPVPHTTGWDQFREIETEGIELSAGDQSIALTPGKQWKPVNVRWVKLIRQSGD